MAQPRLPIAVRAIQLDRMKHGIEDLQAYRKALVVFRLGTAVVGQAVLSVYGGCITSDQLQAVVPSLATPIWGQLISRQRDSSEPTPSASVVVCTRNRTADLELCLPGLSELALQGHEVIVVDNCPTDESTATLVARYPGIQYLREPRPGLDIARNRGLLAAKGEIVAFTDDDAQVDPGWLEALARNFRDPLVAVVTGITMPLELNTEAQQWFESTNAFNRGFRRRQFDLSNQNPLAAGTLGAGVNMAVRRSALPEIGLFDEALDGGTPTLSGGDQEFFFRTLARGYRLVYEPAALVWHRHRREWKALRRTIFGYGVGVFAWWTGALLLERELSLLRLAPKWFLQHHCRNLVGALLRGRDYPPAGLALAEFVGALLGPLKYWSSRRALKRRSPAHEPSLQDPVPRSSSMLDGVVK